MHKEVAEGGGKESVKFFKYKGELRFLQKEFKITSVDLLLIRHSEIIAIKREKNLR